MLKHLTYSALLVCLAVPVTYADDQSWPQWRGPNRTGHAPQTNLNSDWEANPPTLAWKTTGLGSGYASVAVADGVVYTTGNDEKGQSAIAVSEKDGSILWKTPVTEGAPRHGYSGSRSTPALDGDHLYIVSSDGQIVCLKKADGTVVWKKSFKQEWNGRMMSGWGFSESPLVDGDHVICTPGGNDALLVALNKETGAEVWKAPVPEANRGRSGAGYSSVIISNGAGVKQYVQLVGLGIVSVRASDGKFLWSYGKVANRTANIPTPIADGDYIFCSSGYGTGAALLKLSKDGDGVKAEEEYFLTAKTFQNHHGGMIFDNGHIYAGHGHNNGFPICLDMKKGEVVWGGDIRGAGRKSAAIAYVDGHILYRYQTGEVALVKATPEGYELKGSFKPEVIKQPSWAHPAVCNGKLYLREQDTLMVYDISQ